MKIPILTLQKIRMDGTINFSELYTHMKNWLEDMGYANEKTIENKYIERVKDGKKQIKKALHGEKKISEFFIYNIDTYILVLAMSDVEVQQEDRKVKLQKGSFEIRISSHITSTSRWDELKGFQRIYMNLFIRKRIDVYIEELYKKSTSFHSYIKSLLGLRD